MFYQSKNITPTKFPIALTVLIQKSNRFVTSPFCTGAAGAADAFGLLLLLLLVLLLAKLLLAKGSDEPKAELANGSEDVEAEKEVEGAKGSLLPPKPNTLAPAPVLDLVGLTVAKGSLRVGRKSISIV